MKTKGITIWEQHAEKILLGVAALVAIGLVARQFIGEPNAVSTSAGTVAPGEIDALLMRESQAYESRLADAAPAEVDIEAPPKAHDLLVGALERPVNPKASLDLPLLALAPTVDGLGPGGALEFPVPEVGPPYQLATAAYADALADGVLDQFEELQPYFPNPNDPPDLKFVTVFARFDLADLRRQFKGEHMDLEAEGKVAIPSSWYQDRPGNIVDVVIERQELVDGAWTNGKTLAPIPGQVTYRTLLGGEIDAVQRDELLMELADQEIQQEVVQPSFYVTRNEEWSIPVMETEAEETVEDPRATQVRRLREQIKSEKRNLDKDMDRLKQLGGSLDEAPPEEEDRPPGPPSGRRGGAPPGPGGGGGSFGPGGGGGGKRNREGGGFGDDAARNKKAIENIIPRIHQRQKKIDELWARLEVLDPNAEDEAGDADLFNPDADELLVWGHDLDVAPGRTYRYAVSLRIYNPFFGKKRSLVKEQQHLAETFTLDTPASEWSRAIRVDPFTRVWVTSATPSGPGGGSGLGRARVEVYRFYDGRQWVKEFSVQPGDYVGAVEEIRLSDSSQPMRIDFSTNLVVLDIVEDIDTGTGGRRSPLDNSSSATVLLQDVTTGEVLPARDPRADLADSVRRDLRDKAETET
ncbi:MAG: hypothetical protein ACYS0D_03370 [Planctomycetota bacterium]|jgi:hypothetical protein